MFKFIRGLALLITLLLAAVSVNAQDVPPGCWWRSPEVVKQLQVTDGEVRQLEQAFESSRVKLINLISRVEDEQLELQTVLEQNNVEDAAIKAQNRRLESARSALADERFAFYLQVRKIIGPERFQKLLEMAPTGRKGRR